MEKVTLFILILALAPIKMHAQNKVILNIDHKLGEEDFALNQAAQNNLNHDFEVTRLEYYISEISLIHDGGNQTTIEDLWILVDAATETQVDLGDYAITAIEKITLHIGVDPEHNHLDPSSYDASHPLAPKSPSMHWGWTSGYRFVAYEGFGGENLNQLIQLHGLGDTNYYVTEVELNATVSNNSIAINLNADYTRALENISVNNGIIVHGDNFQAKQCLLNFKDYVFSPSNVTSLSDFSEHIEFSIFPNPVTGGKSTILLDSTGSDYNLSITSSEGKQMVYETKISNGQTLDFSEYMPGMYFVNLIKKGKSIKTQKIIIQ